MVRVAVVGCAHGLLDDIYASVQFLNEMDEAHPIELLLCCGDFQSMRNARDLATLACPPKYRQLHGFHQYYMGTKRAPVLTVFVGGNHEASSYLQELHYGGWVAPNIFYLGAAGCIKVGGLRIAGLSGIYKPQDYTAGRYERAPFDNSTMRSVYHVRELEVFQLAHLQQRDPTPVSIFLSHDWPRGIEQYGDVQMLLRRKPFFQQEVQSNSLGSPANEYLLFQLRPAYWFAAHLHVKFAAVVRHDAQATSKTQAADAPDEAAAAKSEATADADAEAKSTAISPPPTSMTKFLALDKCLPRRDFLQVVDIPALSSTSEQDVSTSAVPPSPSERQPLTVHFDLEWLAILRATHHLASTAKHAPRVPQEDMTIEDRDIKWVRQRLDEFRREHHLDHKAPDEWLADFVKTVPAQGEDTTSAIAAATFPAIPQGNPQTDLLLQLLKLPHVVTMPFAGAASAAAEDPNEIDLDLDDDLDGDEQPSLEGAAAPSDPNEVLLDE